MVFPKKWRPTRQLSLNIKNWSIYFDPCVYVSYLCVHQYIDPRHFIYFFLLVLIQIEVLNNSIMCARLQALKYQMKNKSNPEYGYFWVTFSVIFQSFELIPRKLVEFQFEFLYISISNTFFKIWFPFVRNFAEKKSLEILSGNTFLLVLNVFGFSSRNDFFFNPISLHLLSARCHSSNDQKVHETGVFLYWKSSSISWARCACQWTKWYWKNPQKSHSSNFIREMYWQCCHRNGI